MTIRTNLPALTAWRNKKNTGLQQGSAANRLSSGFRINSAADDAAGLAISEEMRTQIRGLDRAFFNTRDGHSLLTTMDGGLDTIGSMLIRKRELTIQALNDTYTIDQRRMIQLEVRQLIDEIDAFANRLEFNNHTLLNRRSALQIAQEARLPGIPEMGPSISLGSVQGVSIESAAFPIDTETRVMLNVNGIMSPSGAGGIFATFHVPQGHWGSFDFNIGGGGIGIRVSVISPNGTIFELNSPFEGLATGYGFIEKGANFGTGGAITEVSFLLPNVSAGGAGEWTVMFDNIQGSDIVPFFARVDVDAGTAVPSEPVPPTISPDLWLQTGANSMQGVNIPTFDARAEALGVHNLSVIGRTSANHALQAIDNALDMVNGFRAIIGANMNRLDHTGNSLLISSENLQDAESRIRNADIAREMMNLSMANILQQAGISMLAQGNQNPEMFLQLLR